MDDMKKQLVENQEHPLIKTPQELVHIKHKISLLQYKYWVLMLRAYREEVEAQDRGFSDEELCFLPMKKVAEYLGYEPKTSEIERDLEAIRKEPIIFNVLEKDGKKAKMGHGFISNWFVSSGRIGVVFPPVIRQAVEQLDSGQAIFHLLNWSIFNSFTGKHEAIIYKLCKDYVGIGKTKYMTLENFREYMGVRKTEYADFKLLNHWVINKSIKKVNASELSDIIITPEFKREGRKVIGLWFLVESKAQTIMDFGNNIAFRFTKVAIALAQQKKYLASSNEESVELSIQRANEYGEEQEKKGKQVDYGALYRKAITEDWGSEYKSKQAKKEEVKAIKQKEVDTEQEKKNAEAKKAQELADWINTTLAKFDSISEEQKTQIRAKFAETLPPFLRKSFDKHGEAAPMHRMKFAQFFEAQESTQAE